MTTHKVGEVGILVLVRRLREVLAVTGDTQRPAILKEVLDPYDVFPPSFTPSSLGRSLHSATARDSRSLS